jgi:hypothetical protein
MPAASLRALLARSIDYAGLFPPCSLALEPALKNHAEYVRSSDAWMLSTFVLPTGQFEAAGKNISQFDSKHPLRVSALGTKTKSRTDFIDALKTTTEAIRSFSARHADLASIAQLEMPLPADVDLLLLSDAKEALGELKVFWEAPGDAAERTIALLAEYNSGKDAPFFGYKLRTGGVAAEAFPNSTQIARALVAAARHRVPIKFTAGLHHPLRQFREEVKTKMHGFLNVLGAAVLAAEHEWEQQQTSVMLEDGEPASFSFDDRCFAWRKWKIENAAIKEHRKFVISFGSCSFDEPREDLHALNLL